MKLLTKAIEEAFKKQGDTSEKDPNDVKIIVKFFNPMGQGTLYATEYNEEERIFFGFVSLFGDHNDELGQFSLTELESIQLPLGMKIERDMYTDLDKYNLKQIIDGERP